MMNILVVDAWLPLPDRDGGSLRMFGLLGLLQELAEGITFAADDFHSRVSGYEALRAREIHVLVPPEVDSLPDFIAQQARAYDVVVLSRAAQAIRYLSLVREHAPRARVIFDTTDLHYLRAFRGAKATRNSKLLMQALELKQHELAAVRAADVTLVVSTAEQEILGVECPQARVHVVSNIHSAEGSTRSFGEREGIVFVGAFPHHPNVDAMRYFFDEIYPRLANRFARVPITIIGSHPPDWLREFEGETVRVTGHVPALKPYLDECRVSFAPLRYGAGVKGKVLESMGWGVPVVLTSMAAEGIPCRDHQEALIADDPDTFAQALSELYCDEPLWNTISENGVELVREHFSADVARRELGRIFQELNPGAVKA